MVDTDSRVKSWMRRLFGQKSQEKHVILNHHQPAENPDTVFSKHFANKSQGHGKPTPRFGAPAMVWHIGIAPKRRRDPTHTSVEYKSGAPIFTDIFDEFKKKQDHLFNESSAINTFIFKLQQGGRVFYEDAEKFKLVTPKRIVAPKEEAFDTLEKGYICFTLWWNKGQQTKYGKPDTPSPDAIRVRVHVQAHIDHLTITFYIDPGKPWNEEPVYTLDSAVGAYRRDIFIHVENVKAISHRRLQSKHIDEPLVPETGLTVDEAEDLAKASDFLYRQIWEDFCSDFGFTMADIQKGDWSCFGLYRGLVLSTEGVKEEGSTVPPPASTASPGISPFYRFADAAIPHAMRHKAPSEANAVVKAFWPFIRRSTPYADEKDYIACGVMDWRALYVTALASPQASGRMEEWDADKTTPIPAGSVLLEYPKDKTLAPAEGEKEQHPIRYLFLTKFEPNPKQIGRIVDRTNTLGTIRLFALKDRDVVINADAHIRIRGQELDAVMSDWSERCLKIQGDFLKSKVELQKKYTKKGKLSVKGEKTIQDREAERDEKLTEVADEVEKYLISISSSLDKIGSRAVGGLHYRIRRSSHYIGEFNTLVRTLQIGNINTWVSYDSYADRGLKPIFDFIIQSGERLIALRERLKVVLESIQTSALVVQTSATRHNTQTLKDLAWTARFSGYGLFGVILVWIGKYIVNYFGSLAQVWDSLKNLFPF